jgi:hypothetical protein
MERPDLHFGQAGIRSRRGWLAFGFTVLCITILVLWEQNHPPSFTVFIRAGEVHYDFRDRDYADEFAALNRAPAP